jgi:hypothetical protein
VTPMQAVRREVLAELDALERIVGDGAAPAAIDIRVEIDRQTGMPRATEVTPSWRRHITGGAIASRKAS